MVTVVTVVGSGGEGNGSEPLRALRFHSVSLALGAAAGLLDNFDGLGVAHSRTEVLANS